jgi:hypothetical protein
MSDGSTPFSRRLVAEALGRAILVATVVGSGIMAEQLAGGNQAIALLGNTIPTGAILVVLIIILGPVSGRSWRDAVERTCSLHFGPMRRCNTWHRAGPLDVRPCSACNRDQGAQWSFTVAGRGCCDIHARTHHPWWVALRALSNSVACRLSDHRRLLVHSIDIVRQPGCDVGAGLHYHLCRDRYEPRSSVYHCATHRSRSGRNGFGPTLSVCGSPVRSGACPGRVIAVTGAVRARSELVSWMYTDLPETQRPDIAGVHFWPKVDQ